MRAALERRFVPYSIIVYMAWASTVLMREIAQHCQEEENASQAICQHPVNAMISRAAKIGALTAILYSVLSLILKQAGVSPQNAMFIALIPTAIASSLLIGITKEYAGLSAQDPTPKYRSQTP